MLTEVRNRKFANGVVFALKTADGFPIETTDTFLPFYTKDAVGRKQNSLQDYELGTRAERWMIGVSVMSGCPVRCKFCATGQLKTWRNLTADEIVEQVFFVLAKNNFNPRDSKEFKINYTRMGEPFLNIENVREAIAKINAIIPNVHHYISTIGVKDADYGWIRDNITLQFSIHAMTDERRNWLIPYKRKAKLADLGKVRTASNLKTTLNLTLVDESDFDITALKENFDPKCFFVKLSPINVNKVSENNHLGNGAIEGLNMA